MLGLSPDELRMWFSQQLGESDTHDITHFLESPSVSETTHEAFEARWR